MEIESVTHASLWIRTAGISFLVDPYFYPELDPTLAPGIRHFPPRDLNPAQFGFLDFVLSSHEHQDHCHPQTLEVLRDRIGTVLMPADRPLLEKRYREAGLENIRFLQNWETVKLGPDLEVTCIWDDPVDSLLVLKSEGRTLIHASDCLLKLETVQAISKAFRVDYAFVGHTSAQELFPYILPRPKSELERLARVREQQFLETQLWRLAVLEPRIVIPYAFSVAYVLPEQFWLNRYGRTTPPVFAQAVEARGLPCQCLVLQPGDVMDCSAEEVRRYRRENLWGRDLPEYLVHLQQFADSIAATLPPFEPEEPGLCAEKLEEFLQERVVRQGAPFRSFYRIVGDAVAVHLAGRSETLSFRVEPLRRSVRRWDPADPDGWSPRLEITIPPSILNMLLDEVWDAFMVLYMYRVEFKVDPEIRARGLTPSQECSLCLGAFLTLFMNLDEKYLPVMGEELAVRFPECFPK